MQNITAIRLELLTDPEPARRRSRPLDQRHGRADRIPRRGRAGRRPAKIQKVKIVKATADINLPETPLEPKFDDKAARSA